MNVPKFGAFSAASVAFLLTIAGCGTTDSGTSSASSPGSQQSSENTVREPQPDAVDQDPSSQGFTVAAAGVTDDAVKGCAALGLKAEDFATTGLTELGLGSRTLKGMTICIFQEPGLEHQAENRITVAVIREKSEADKYTIPETYEMHAQVPGNASVDIGDKAHYGDDVNSGRPKIGESLWALKGEKMVTIHGSSDRESFPQGYGQDVYETIAAKLVQDL